MTAQSQI